MRKLLSSLNDIEIIKESDNPSDLIGYGALSQVRKARHKATGKMYAVKEMDLKTIHPNDIKNITREIKTHIFLDHPNIVKLYDNYTAPNQKLYLLLEYCDNNNLFHFIQKSRLDEKVVHKFFYQTVQAIEYIHKRKIMHRDLKPENILLDKNFNVKVCDFGWCAEYNEHERRQTFCGTNEYMAPEILDKERQDFGIDIWALGILLYEMYHKKAPFTGRSPHEISKAIKRRKLVFSASPMCAEAKDIIDKILQMDPRKRLTIEQFYTHPYFHKYPFFRLVSDDSKTIAAKNSRRSYVGGEERNEIMNSLAKKTRAPSPNRAQEVGPSGNTMTPTKLAVINENPYMMDHLNQTPQSKPMNTMIKVTTPSTTGHLPTFTSPNTSNKLIQSEWNLPKAQPPVIVVPQPASLTSLGSGLNSLNTSQVGGSMSNNLVTMSKPMTYAPTPASKIVTSPNASSNIYSFNQTQSNNGSLRDNGDPQASSRTINEERRDLDKVAAHINQVSMPASHAQPVSYQPATSYQPTVSYQPYQALQSNTYIGNNYPTSHTMTTNYSQSNGQAENQQQHQNKPVDLNSSQIITREYSRTEITPSVQPVQEQYRHTGFTNLNSSGIQTLGSPTSHFMNKPHSTTIHSTSSNWIPQSTPITSGTHNIYSNQPSLNQGSTVQPSKTWYAQDNSQSKPAEWKYTPSTPSFTQQGSYQASGTSAPLSSQAVIRSDTRASYQKVTLNEPSQQYRSPIGSPLMTSVTNGAFLQTPTYSQQPTVYGQQSQYQPQVKPTFTQPQSFGQFAGQTTYQYR